MFIIWYFEFDLPTQFYPTKVLRDDEKDIVYKNWFALSSYTLNYMIETRLKSIGGSAKLSSSSVST